MKTMRSNGSESNERVNHPVDHSRGRDAERTRSQGTGQAYEEEEEGLSGENNFGTGREFAMAVDAKKRHEGEKSKDVHVEDWENDPYSYQKDEDDVRGELNVRKNGRNERGGELMDEQTRWRSHGGTNSTDNRQRDGDRESRKGNDETIGVP